MFPVGTLVRHDNCDPRTIYRVISSDNTSEYRRQVQFFSGRRGKMEYGMYLNGWTADVSYLSRVYYPLLMLPDGI